MSIKVRLGPCHSLDCPLPLLFPVHRLTAKLLSAFTTAKNLAPTAPQNCSQPRPYQPVCLLGSDWLILPPGGLGPEHTSVVDNVCFGQELDAPWLETVLEACALWPDVDGFPAGSTPELGSR